MRGEVMREFSEEEGKRASLLGLLIIVASFVSFILMVKMGIAPGLEAGHPSEYLVATFIAVGILMSTLPIMWYFGIVRMPLWFTALLIADMYYYAISMFFGMYLRYIWWGDIGHVASSLCVTAIAFLALCILQSNSPKHVTLGSKAGVLFLVLMIGISLGGIWEVMEGYVDIMTGTPYMSYGIWDNLMDLRADTAGAIIMTALGYFLLRKYTVEEISKTTRIKISHKKDMK